MEVAIIKYNAGNICSVVNAFRRLGVVSRVTGQRDEILSADCVVFPGQGNAATTMAYLHASGLDRLFFELRQPVLGICIGQQLLCAESEEGPVPCLNVFPSVPVRRFVPLRHEDKIPHMGWNTLSRLRSPLFKGIGEGAYVYYVHSYYVPVTPFTIAETDYIHPFSAALQKDNFYSTQFHPEKSGQVGEQILRNFLDIAYDRTDSGH